MKKDKYLNARGGTAKHIDLSYAKCEEKLFTYQKDGPGFLKRCYLNRILGREELSSAKTQEEMKNLKCSCGELMGTPMKYEDRRLAFKIMKGKIKRTINKEIK